MPYMILMTRNGRDPKPKWESTEIIYDNPQEASQYCKAENQFNTSYGHNDVRFKVKAITLDDPFAWRLREAAKFTSGEFKRPPWYEDGYSNGNMLDHIDPNDPAKVRFFAVPEDAWRGKYTSMSPGRFVRAFVDSYIHEDLIDKWCAEMGIDENVSELLIAKKPKDIRKVYTFGPHSCMSYRHEEGTGGPFSSTKYHPTEAYGNSDLAVAYIERRGEITGRCLIWPKKKIHGRIYGDTHRMLKRLQKEGYTENWEGFVGARIRLLRDGRKIIAPYFDGDCGAIIEKDILENKEWFLISDKPHVILKSPYGRITGNKCQECGAKDIHLTVRRNGDGEIIGVVCADGCVTEAIGKEG